MMQLPFHAAKPQEDSRLFGLRIESHVLQVAIATPQADGRFRLDFDTIRCPAEEGWMSVAGKSMLRDALATLAERHEMRRHRVAVSLDGDFCVTRVAMGSPDEVDQELAALANRVPRYLQLGPGEKVVGGSRARLTDGVEYAVTGVVNRSMIQLIYDALRTVDIDVAWVEPSLVSVSRLVGEAELGQDDPIMIADGTGQQWDVGISCNGRLLLDYRPAAADSEEGFREALDGHISRLQRFCHRHRGIVTGHMNRLFLCANGEKLVRAVETLGETLGLEPVVLHVPRIDSLYEIDAEDREAQSVPAVAAVLPLMIDVNAVDVPDLLREVRRAPDLSWQSRLLRCGWPAVAAILFLCMAFGLVTHERRRSEQVANERGAMEAAFEATKARYSKLAQARGLVGHLLEIKKHTRELDWDQLLVRVTQSLPDVAKLNEYRIESGGRIRLEGAIQDESAVYDLVENLRLVPGVTQVALRGTSPDPQSDGTRFVIHLLTEPTTPPATGA